MASSESSIPAEKATLSHLFEHSSQHRNWRFSHDQLAEIRRATNATAIKRFKKSIEEEEKESNSNGVANAQLYLTPEEELKLSTYFQKRAFDAAKHVVAFPDNVSATAVIYLKRFFLYNSVMDYPPHKFLLVCLFLATKSENERMTLEEFVGKTKFDSSEDMMDREFTISQGIKFEYRIHHSYSPAKGFFYDIQTVTKDLKKLKQTYDRVIELIHGTHITDLPFLYPPSQIALACYWIAAKETTFDLQSYLDAKLRDHIPMLQSIFEDVEKTIREFKVLEREEATAIDKKRINVVNPAKNPESAIYKKRELEREKAEDEKRLKKAKSNDSTELSKIMQ